MGTIKKANDNGDPVGKNNPKNLELWNMILAVFIYVIRAAAVKNVIASCAVDVVE